MSEPSATKTAENSAAPKPAPAPKPRGRPFTPGVSGNPKGRPQHALSEAIRRQCEPDELVKIALTIARKSKSEALRLQALGWLRDSGYQRPADRHEHAVEQTSAPEHDWSRIPIAERLALMERVRVAPTAGQQPTGAADDDHATNDDARPPCAPETP